MRQNMLNPPLNASGVRTVYSHLNTQSFNCNINSDSERNMKQVKLSDVHIFLHSDRWPPWTEQLTTARDVTHREVFTG